MAGALDDMLYGLIAMTKTETDVRTTYIKDEAPDSRVLATLIKPTKEDPLRAMVLRWSLVYQTLHKIGVTTPRDLVYLESVGSRILPSGERIGYAVLHSVDVPGCDELKDLGIVRCKFSTCYLLRDTGHGSVELYMRTYMDPGGRIVDRLAVFVACTSLIAIWRVMLCGQYKKLAWMLRRAGRASMVPTAANDGGDLCPICEKNLSGLRSASQCDICKTRVCSRCSDKRKLTQVVSRKQIKQVATCVCRTCISVASQTSAREVALSEYVAPSDHVSSYGERQSFVSQPRSSSSQTPSRKVTLIDASMSISSSSSQRSTLVDASLEAQDGGLDWDDTRSTAAKVSPIEDEAQAGVDPEQLQLWIRMNQLRMAAEETYMITKQNAVVMLETMSASSDTGDESTLDRSRSTTVEKNV